LAFSLLGSSSSASGAGGGSIEHGASLRGERGLGRRLLDHFGAGVQSSVVERQGDRI
jgi:hypothetical protein